MVVGSVSSCCLIISMSAGLLSETPSCTLWVFGLVARSLFYELMRQAVSVDAYAFRKQKTENRLNHKIAVERPSGQASDASVEFCTLP